jgi:hypothetical protein
MSATADPPPSSEAPSEIRANLRASRRQLTLALALLLGVLATALVVHEQRDVGIARDEVVYMHAGSRYAAWWTGLSGGRTHLSRASITEYFGGPNATDNNREHPPLVKTLAGLSEQILHDGLGWAGELTAYRLPGAALHGLLIALIFAFTARWWGRSAGALAALFLLLMPRPLFHAGLLCFDGPITALWFATVIAYHHALVTGRRLWLAGVCFGLALATKHNAFLLPFAVGAHYVYAAWRRRAQVQTTEATTEATTDTSIAARGFAALRATGLAMLRLRPWLLVTMALVGPLVLIALWPWLWFSPAQHLAQWIGFHTHHVHYNFEYLGTNWNAPPFPWHVALVTTWLTVPAITLASALVGIWSLARGLLPVRADATGNERSSSSSSSVRKPDEALHPALLLLLSAAASMGPFFLRSTPIFGAEKHWEPAMPSLAIAAAVGLVTVGRGAARWLGHRAPKWNRPRAGHAVVALLAAAALTSAAIETFHPQPYGLSAYTSLAGGAPGAADLGMNRQFWGVAARGVLPELATFSPPAGAPPVPVYTHDASPAWGVYQRLGLVPPGLPDAGPEAMGIERSALAIVIHERHFARHDFMIWQAYGTVQPIFVLRLDGVPLVSVYKRPMPGR